MPKKPSRASAANGAQLPKARTADLLSFADFRSATDEELGALLLAGRIGAEVEEKFPSGFDLLRSVERYGPSLIEKIAAQEAGSVKNVALEKALRLACSGEFAKAGALFRAYMFDGASRQVQRKHALNALAQLARRRLDGEKGAAERRVYTDTDRAQWREMAANPEWTEHSVRRRAELIAQQLYPDNRGASETIRKEIKSKKTG